MATYEQVHGDITHIQAMLEEQRSSLPDGHDMTSAIATQASAVLQMLRNLRDLTHEQSMGLQRVVFAGPWTGLQKGEFADVLTSQHSGSASASPQRQLVESFAAYLTLDDVQKLSDPQLSLLAKVQVLADRCLSVGIVKPLEKSWKPIMAAGLAAGMMMQTHERLPYLEELKRIVALGRKGKPLPVPYITKFPNDPMDLPPTLKQCFVGATMGAVEEGQGLAARSQVDLRRSSKSQRSDAMVPFHPQGRATGSMPVGAMGMPGGAGGMNPSMMMMMGAQYFMSMMQQQGMNPFQASPKDLVYLTPSGKGTHSPRTPWAPSKSPPADESQESQPEETPAVKPLQLFDTGADGDLEKTDARKTSSTGMTAIEQAAVVEAAISERAMAKTMKRPAAAKPAAAKPAASKGKAKALASEKSKPVKKSAPKTTSASKGSGSQSHVRGKSIYGLARDKFKSEFKGKAADWEAAWKKSKACQQVLSKMSHAERVKRRLDYLWKGD